MIDYLCRSAFRALCRVGQPIGGVRPRRIYHWLARRGYPDRPGSLEEFRWHRDRWGHRFLLHPYYFIDRHIIAFGNYEAELIEFLDGRLRPGMVCLDIGANLGELTVHMASRVGPTGRVHAFEPVPHVRERLATQVRQNGLGGIVEVHPIALSDRTGSARMRHAAAEGANQGMGSLLRQAHDAGFVEIEVETMRLDDFVGRHRIERLDWMKVDIQGAEPMLLSGAADTLARLAPEMVMEISPIDLEPLGKTSRDLLALLEQHGYRQFEIRGREAGRSLESGAVPADYTADNIYCTRSPGPA